MTIECRLERLIYRVEDFEVGKTYGGTVAGEFWKDPEGRLMLMWHYDGRVSEVNPHPKFRFHEVQKPDRPITRAEFIEGRRYKHPKLRGYFEKYKGQTWFTSYINGSSYECSPQDHEQFFQLEEVQDGSERKIL